jgi:acetyltransferase-like isoleucine patch superfamily enzyme
MGKELNVFEQIQKGEPYDIRQEDYQRDVHGEIGRCDHICWELRMTDPSDRERLLDLETELFNGTQGECTFITPPMFIDCASQVHLGNNVYINHNLTMMSLGGITIDDGVMIGPGTSLLTVNHEPKNIRVVMAKPIHIKKNAWIGGSVRILPGVTIGENAIVGTGAVVTKNVPDNTIVVGVPARIVKTI